MTRPRVAIPRAMYFYEQGELWERFFKALGCEVLYSPNTSRDILDSGTAASPSEACLPVKVFMGHVKYLDGKADYIFIPTLYSLEQNAFNCPEACALSDMAKLCLGLTTPILSVELDVRRGVRECSRLAGTLGLSEDFVRGVLDSAVLSRLGTGAAVPSAVSGSRSKIAVVGHPYILYDPVISMGISEKLERRGYYVLTAASTVRRERVRLSVPFAGKHFWSEGYDLLGASCALMSRSDVAGLIFLTPFACGIDSVVVDLVRRRIKAYPGLRFMSLSLDEHTGQAGFDTRLEAFLDILSGSYKENIV